MRTAGQRLAIPFALHFFLHCMFGLVFLLALQFFALQCFLCSSFLHCCFCLPCVFFCIAIFVAFSWFPGLSGGRVGVVTRWFNAGWSRVVVDV